MPKHTTVIQGPNLQELQNVRADEEHLVRIASKEELEAFIKDGTLIQIPPELHLAYPPEFEDSHKVCTPWTAKFIEDLSGEFYAAFKHSLQLNSAVRTKGDQLAIKKRGNLNAAPTDGPKASTHLTGATLDITKRPIGKKGRKGWMSRAELAWMRSYLSRMMGENKIIFVEEKYQAVFHIWVSRQYAGVPTPAGG